jgi:predicted metal-binding membrane protein
MLMWLLMSTAMMLPTALPAFAAYDDIAHTGTQTALLALVAGFLAVWGGFALVAAGLQMALFRLDLVSSFGDSRSYWLSAALLAVAGGYQFTPLKHACLSKCRAPLTFFLQHWDAGPWRMGLRLGATCLGCCWALMLLAFVGGVMSLAFMGIATLFMVLEKLPDIGRWLSRPLGYALLGGATWLAVTGL